MIFIFSLILYFVGYRMRRDLVFPSLSYWDWAALGLLLVIAITFGHPHENVIVGRDPGVYTNAGIHLARTGQWSIPDAFLASLPQDTQQAFDLHTSPLLNARMFGFFWLPDTGEAASQFLPFYSVWIALLERFLGETRGQWTALFFTLVGALGLYSLAARFWHPRAGIVVLLLLLSNPAALWQSRSANAEVALQVLFFLLIFIWHERRDLSLPWGEPIIFASIILASLLTKLDMIFFLPLLLLIYSLAWLGHVGEIHLGRILCTTVGATIAVILFMARFSGPYLLMTFDILTTRSNPLVLVYVIAVLVLVTSIVVILLPTLRSKIIDPYRQWVARFQGIPQRSRQWIGLVLALLFVLLYFVLPSTVQDHTTADIRLSLVRLSWYTTPVAWWLTGISAIHMVRRRPSWGQLLLISLFVSSLAMLFLGTRLDHIWTIRRYVPVVIPGLLLLSGGALEILWRWRPRRLPALGRSLAIVLGMAMIVGQGMRTLPLLPHREFAGTTRFLQELAAKFPERAVIIIDPLDAGGGESILASFIGPHLWLAYDLEPLYMARPLAASDWRAIQEQAQQDGRALFYIGEVRPPCVLDADSTALHALTMDVPALEHTIDRFPSRVVTFHFQFTVWQLSPGTGMLLYRPGALFTQIGQAKSVNEEVILESLGNAGFLSYGPYHRFGRGKYLARFALQNAGTESAEIRLDVTPFEHPTLGQVVFTLAPQSDWRVAEVPFDVGDDTSADAALELRVFLPKGGIVRLRQLEIVPLGKACN
jgi:hypothetical protein